MVKRTVTAKIRNTGNVAWTFHPSLSIDAGDYMEGIPLSLEPGQEGTASWEFDDSSLSAGEHEAIVSVWSDYVGGTKIAEKTATFNVEERIAAEIESITID